jgi:hypothetical protein
MRRLLIAVTILTVQVAGFDRAVDAAPRSDGELQIEIVDSATGAPIPARMHLKTSRGRPAKLSLPETAEYGGHFYIDGRLTLPLRQGQYTFELEATPEYLTQSGHFDIQRHANDSKRIEMKRFVDLSKEGWWAGDVDFERNEKYLPLILRAEGLQDVRTREFATILSDQSHQPASRGSTRLTAGNPQSDICIAATPYAWNLPIWLASGKLDAIELIHGHALREGVKDNEDDGRPRDRSLFPGKNGNGRWSEAVYYHVLNCGFRIPPVAGSGSGANDNPVGANRVYVYCGSEFSADGWWDEMKAGKVFVSNGPLLRPLVEGQPPGYVFYFNAGGTVNLEIGLNLATRVPVEYLQIIKNGAVESEVRLADWKKDRGRLPPVHFTESGWFLVRAVTNNPRGYQLASSGPYYVEQTGKSRVSRASVQFFLDWIDAAKKRIDALPKLPVDERDALLAEHDVARNFFAELLITANAE